MNTEAFEQSAVHLTSYQSTVQTGSQYRFWQILGFWAVVTVPMALLTWVVAPELIPISPLHPGITYWLVTIVGMFWQMVVSLVILYRELGSLRWSALRQRTWLQIPRHPKTNQPMPKLFIWVIPCLVLSAIVNLGFAGYLESVMASLFPSLQPAPYMDFSRLAVPEFQRQWWLLGIAVVSAALNYFLGEELLFRGVLLPKMQGVFGKFDWLANAILFSMYHLHKPWTLPTQLLGNLVISWPARYFRSNWMAIIVHGVEVFLFLGMVLVVILGVGN